MFALYPFTRWLTLSLLLALLAAPTALADGDEWGEWGGRPRGVDRGVTDQLTQEECSACHMAYPAWLLPPGSWESMMGDLQNHFGDDASLDPESRSHITNYLVMNAGGKAWYQLANPSTITGQWSFMSEHWFSQDYIDREARGSLANCEGCHRGAEDGWFDDD